MNFLHHLVVGGSFILYIAWGKNIYQAKFFHYYRQAKGSQKIIYTQAQTSVGLPARLQKPGTGVPANDPQINKHLSHALLSHHLITPTPPINITSLHTPQITYTK